MSGCLWEVDLHRVGSVASPVLTYESHLHFTREVSEAFSSKCSESGQVSLCCSPWCNSKSGWNPFKRFWFAYVLHMRTYQIILSPYKVQVSLLYSSKTASDSKETKSTMKQNSWLIYFLGYPMSRFDRKGNNSWRVIWGSACIFRWKGTIEYSFFN